MGFTRKGQDVYPLDGRAQLQHECAKLLKISISRLSWHSVRVFSIIVLMKLRLIIYAGTQHENANLHDLTGYVKLRKVEPTSLRTRKATNAVRFRKVPETCKQRSLPEPAVMAQ